MSSKKYDFTIDRGGGAVEICILALGYKELECRNKLFGAKTRFGESVQSGFQRKKELYGILVIRRIMRCIVVYYKLE
ncbi:hypothetical protein TNCT_423031 [Trichonephila clavata]|uniref:Uncharacterized protein n=1 Tax=Trichonephila clavata TaxID=2740835 RepID=A0A8X6GH97_TRICU|nr:hypothetical protein TNCT_423031 [Trichonephila clavata]